MTQHIAIHYNFIGVLDLPAVEESPENVGGGRVSGRQGRIKNGAVEAVPSGQTAPQK